MAGSVLARHALALWVAGVGRGVGGYIYAYMHICTPPSICALRGLVGDGGVDICIEGACACGLLNGYTALCFRSDAGSICVGGTPVSHKVSGRDVPDDAVVMPKSACNRNQLARQLAEAPQKAFREQ